MHLNYIEIGTSDFDTFLQNSDLTGISIDPLKIYLDRLPDKENNEKINAAISDFDGTCEVFYVHPEDIEKYNLPGWIRGCNSVIRPHKSVIQILKENNLESIYKKESVDSIKWCTLIKSRGITGIDYLKIDTEGHDCVIIRDILNSEAGIYPREIKFEANTLTPEGEIQNTIDLLLSKGYELISRDSENVTVRFFNPERVKMKIGKVIFSVDDNPKYQGLWPIVSEICFKKLGIIPVLFHITDIDSEFYKDEYGLVKKVKAIEGIKSGVQSQLIRMWGTKFFGDEVCLTSDIDMVMINKEYFTDQVKDVDRDSLVIYCSDAYDSQREECVGIYSGNRYPICYNAGTGSTFNKILGTDCDFETYINKVLSMGFPDFDSDEMYFGHMVNTIDHGINVIKIKRGFYTKFKCPGRIDRIDDSQFNKYDKDALDNGEYIDCHLSRPASKYLKEIESLKSKILRNKEIYLIGCHIENNRQLELLSELISKLKERGKDYVITSHTTIPEFIIRDSLGFIYDSVNPKYKSWDLKNPNKYTIYNDTFSLTSPYITYGRREYYHVGVIRLLINGINYLKNLDYQIVHWIEYDTLPDFDLDSSNVNYLKETDFIFYGIGSKFSFNLERTNPVFMNLKNTDILRILSENDYVAEKVISNYLTEGKKKVINVEENSHFYGRYSHNFEINFDWSLYEDSEVVNIFINNSGSSEIKFEINYGDNHIILESHPHTWILNPIAKRDLLKSLSINADNNKIADLDLTNDDIYEKVVKSVDIKFN